MSAPMPTDRDLRDPGFEHDGCGVAFVATTSGTATHHIVAAAMRALVNLGHRGATGSDPDTGDGAGILLQVPDDFLRARAGVELPPAGGYGVGMVFLPAAAAARRTAQALIAECCADEGVHLLGWRDVPIDATVPGITARKAMPRIRQFFVAAVGLDGDALERRLYVLRRVIESRACAAEMDRRVLHIASLSSRTLVYKGMLTAEQLGRFYTDLHDETTRSALALVHARFSTNVLPRWDLAQPLRMSAHNGEINTIRGNAAWMSARQSKFRSALFGGDIDKIRDVLDAAGSDSTQFDNALELLTMSGRSIEHAMMMMIPEAWQSNDLLDDERRAFYEFHASLLEPWDGPAAIAFTDGRLVGACLDRNGLRPARYLVTDDGLVVMASEAGVLDIPEERIVKKWRLDPGRLLLVDTEAGAILDDGAIKRQLAGRHPYGEWIRGGTVRLDELTRGAELQEPDSGTLRIRQHLFGWTDEDLRLVVAPMASKGEEPVGSMGNDAPLAVLSDRPQPLFAYFKQLFAQVTNPPIDPIREVSVMSLATSLGAGGNMLEQGPGQAARLEMAHPILTSSDLATIRHVTQRQFPAETINAVFHRAGGADGLRDGLDRICRLASEAVSSGRSVLIVSDRGADAGHVPIPSLLATAAIHHHLLRERTRTGVGLVVESGEPREVAHLALLIGYGAEAVNPYLLLDTAAEMAATGVLENLDAAAAQRNMIHALRNGLLKTIAKMGISTALSYCGAQLFEAIGLAEDVVDRYFTGTPTRIGGSGLDRVAADALSRHGRAFPARGAPPAALDPGGSYQWRRNGEKRAWNPEVIGALQHAVRSESSADFARYVALADRESAERRTLRGLLELREADTAVPLDEVESADTLVHRFATGAMSLGSISPEMHETLAIAMNRIGGRSNTGEGGEDAARFESDGPDSRRSAIKQVASARFGVTAHFLINADEIQIKVAQGAKPGEGGQLPGHKVDVTIAHLRHATPGVGLISPPPHHDVYSVEDLAQLIHDLRSLNPTARISVKLVAEMGVGPIAAAVAKARADHIVVSGYEGGTGAAPLSSLTHAGAPWELGLAEAQQTLVANGLRDRVVLQSDGLMRTGRDVVVAALLGAEEFAFATAPLVAAGCVMMRVCHLNTCPVGIATQDPDLRARYTGRAEHVVTFMRFLAEDVRRWMSRLGVRRFEDLVGRVELLRQVDSSGDVDLARLLVAPGEPRHFQPRAAHAWQGDVDERVIAFAGEALESGNPLQLRMRVSNRDRSVGARLSGEVAMRHGAAGLPPDTIRVHLQGSAGQSFGAWLAGGITLTVQGEVNDGCGKGLSGGRIVVVPPANANRPADDNVIAGNVLLYGATSGELYARGVAGERFAVRNSGAHAVVEGTGDHALEYMTGGVVIILGRTGRNVAAGMSGGLGYVLDVDGRFTQRCNTDMVRLVDVDEDTDGETVRKLLEHHLSYTGSPVAEELLEGWPQSLQRFVKVLPIDYERAMAARPVKLEVAV
ncbi:MAG: glutamate synthase large subunit [Candidatus Aeolococcus gillhamiae]|uniref:Glutamate synthase large subunit n=1 Tax=Candidatus Aeolococcus gillhamiae TaxID=3127015 RepID=A0A2W5Z5L6_9BACT|nr:MAG: glutamate synthase large subunit [Candidatus Dormibacter sp. RRmetagenome_bin12]